MKKLNHVRGFNNQVEPMKQHWSTKEQNCKENLLNNLSILFKIRKGKYTGFLGTVLFCQLKLGLTVL